VCPCVCVCDYGHTCTGAQAAIDGDAAKIHILALHAGSIRVAMALDEGVCAAGLTAAGAADALQLQALDPSSRLKQGRFTSCASAAHVRCAACLMTATERQRDRDRERESDRANKREKAQQRERASVRERLDVLRA